MSLLAVDNSVVITISHQVEALRCWWLFAADQRMSRATELEIRHMTRVSQRMVAAACALSLVACTSFLSEQGQTEASGVQLQAQRVVVGDVLRIKPKSAPAFELVVTAITADALAGTQDGKPRQVQFNEVESLERKRFDGWRTALLMGGLAFIALGQFVRGSAKLANP
jgi:hypothetical protein